MLSIHRRARPSSYGYKIWRIMCMSFMNMRKGVPPLQMWFHIYVISIKIRFMCFELCFSSSFSFLSSALCTTHWRRWHSREEQRWLKAISSRNVWRHYKVCKFSLCAVVALSLSLSSSSFRYNGHPELIHSRALRMNVMMVNEVSARSNQFP